MSSFLFQSPERDIRDQYFLFQTPNQYEPPAFVPCVRTPLVSPPDMPVARAINLSECQRDFVGDPATSVRVRSDCPHSVVVLTPGILVNPRRRVHFSDGGHCCRTYRYDSWGLDPEQMEIQPRRLSVPASATTRTYARNPRDTIRDTIHESDTWDNDEDTAYSEEEEDDDTSDNDEEEFNLSMDDDVPKLRNKNTIRNSVVKVQLRLAQLLDAKPETTVTPLTTVVNESDVLCGRGVTTNNYIGNKMFRALVTEHQAFFLSADKNGRTLLSKRIVRMIEEKGGRFMHRGEDGLWTDAGEEKALKKTSQALRRGLDVRSFTAGKSSGHGKRKSSSSSFMGGELKENDVLFGPGPPMYNYTGNKMFRALLAKHRKEYFRAKKEDKTRISKRIVRIIQEKGGRFLHRGEDGLWTDAGEEKAFKKTSQAMREGFDVRSFKAGKASCRNGELFSQDEPDEANVTPRSTSVQLKEVPALIEGGIAPIEERGMRRRLRSMAKHKRVALGSSGLDFRNWR